MSPNYGEGLQGWDAATEEKIARLEAKNARLRAAGQEALNNLDAAVHRWKDDPYGYMNAVASCVRPLVEALSSTSAHEHTADCYGNYNAPTVLTCGESTPISHAADGSKRNGTAPAPVPNAVTYRGF